MMSLLFETASRICGSLSLEKSFHQAFQVLQQHMPVDGIYSDIFLKEKQKLQFLAHADRGRAQRLSLEVVIPKALAKTLDDPERPQVFRVADIQEDPITAYSAPHLVPRIGSFLLMRMALEHQHLGVIILYSHRRAAFDSRHQEIFEKLHDPFALATANALPSFQARDIAVPDNLGAKASKVAPAFSSIWSPGEGMIGMRGGLADVARKVEQVAGSDVTVLILGETGTGKEKVADALHGKSGRNGPLVKVNCGAIPESLFDSEFFGHERGAFTDAKEARPGYFEQAHGGTLFLDEISELPLSGQVRLLRVLQDKVVTRVGGRRPVPLDVRIVAATHRDLPAMVKAGAFRSDLWYRLNIFPIELPPLRARGEDLPELISHFLNRFRRKYNVLQAFQLSDTAKADMLRHGWPGNVRELENTLERMVLQSLHGVETGTVVSDVVLQGMFQQSGSCSLPVGMREAPGGVGTLDEALRGYLLSLLQKSGGRIDGKGGAAEIAGVPPSTLRSKIKKAGLGRGCC